MDMPAIGSMASSSSSKMKRAPQIPRPTPAPCSTSSSKRFPKSWICWPFESNMSHPCKIVGMNRDEPKWAATTKKIPIPKMVKSPCLRLRHRRLRWSAWGRSSQSPLTPAMKRMRTWPCLTTKNDYFSNKHRDLNKNCGEETSLQWIWNSNLHKIGVWPTKFQLV